MFSNRNSFNNSFSNLSKINPFNPRKTAHITNNFSKKKFLIPNSNREFGKEINISSNLATNNQDIFNNRKSMGIPIEQKYKNLKKEKELLNNKLKNYEQIIAMRKKKKPISNSMMIYKPNNSSSKYQSSKGSIIQIKKDNKFKYKNQSQKNIFNANKTMNINDDVVMVDENSNPNIIINNNNIENEKNININQTKNQNDEDVEMKIETENNISINNEPQKFSNPQNADTG